MLQHMDTVLSFAVVMLLLSLLVTTIVQIVIALLGLRGIVLRWGIERLLTQVAPDLKDYAADIAETVLRHPAVCNVRRWRATAIRRDEFMRLLEDLAYGDSLGSAGGGPIGQLEQSWPRRLAVRLLRFVGIVESVPAPLTDNAKKALKGTLEKGASADTQEWATSKTTLRSALEKAFPKEVSKVRDAVDRAMGRPRQMTADVGVWFNIVMDRTADRFLIATRLVTVIVAAVLTFVLHVDSLDIISELAASPDVRARLVQSAGATLDMAEDAFALAPPEKAVASAAIKAARADVNVSDANAFDAAPDDLVTRQEGEDWINKAIKDAPAREAFLNAYGKRFDEKNREWLQQLRQSADRIKKRLEEPSLAIVPSPLPGWTQYFSKPRHLLGTLMTVFFLSLGAPFWYNTLRQLSTLRPIIAERIDPKQRGRAGDRAGGPSPRA